MQCDPGRERSSVGKLLSYWSLNIIGQEPLALTTWKVSNEFSTVTVTISILGYVNMASLITRHTAM